MRLEVDTAHGPQVLDTGDVRVFETRGEMIAYAFSPECQHGETLAVLTQGGPTLSVEYWR